MASGYSSKHLIFCWVILLLECTAICSSALFEVLGSYPVSASIGEDLVLPCSLKPKLSAVNMTVEWFRLKHQEQGSLVHLYKDGRVQNDKQMQSYKGRTSLFKDELNTGNTSLKLSSVQLSDEGDYKCFVRIGSHYDDALVQVFLRVIGKEPLITMEGITQDSGISLVCESEGWWPEPVLEWLDSRGRVLPAEPPKTHLSPNGIGVKRRLVAYDSDANYYVCKLKQHNERIAFEKEVVMEAQFHISDGVFNQPWKTGFIVILSFLLACLTLELAIFCKYRLLKKKINDQLTGEKEQKEAALNQKTDLETKLAEMKTKFKAERDRRLQAEVFEVFQTKLCELERKSHLKEREKKKGHHISPPSRQSSLQNLELAPVDIKKTTPELKRSDSMAGTISNSAPGKEHPQDITSLGRRVSNSNCIFSAPDITSLDRRVSNSNCMLSAPDTTSFVKRVFNSSDMLSAPDNMPNVNRQNDASSLILSHIVHPEQIPLLVVSGIQCDSSTSQDAELNI